ncbi:MAG: hypothetical protein AABX53_01345 [Nanoarchaeota archaeon]
MHTCTLCEKQFQSAEALGQHRKAIHGQTPDILTKSASKRYLAWIGIIILVTVLGYGASTFYTPNSASDVALAQCIADSGAKFYGAFWCSHCNDQKELFGSAAKYLPYIECSNADRSQKQICASVGIDAYPTWVFADGTRGNVFTKLELSRRTGCPLV